MTCFLMALMVLRVEKVQIKTSTAGNKRGFTLLELLIVLFIIGIVVSIVAVSVGRMRDKTVFTEEARRIFLTTKQARETAILDRTEVAFRLNEETNTYWLDYAGSKPSENHAVPRKFVITGADIFFFPKGNSSGGLIEIQNEKGQKYAIEVKQVLGTSSIKRL
ncbi:MAG: prepilin-type N-terminal cleavage/methylation domain-containing protein [Nitrospirae bacterium]|nr:prepilin-type N-terminal cleavage/methylation domain-containing protein [Nitrospirota bacterium]